MKYYQDYIEMIEDKFIEEKLFFGLHGDGNFEFQRKIQDLKSDLQNMYPNERAALIKGLQIMSELGCYKAALSAKINTAIVSDIKEPENKYVHVRGSVLYDKKKRVWISHYLGETEKYCDNKGKVKTGVKESYRLNVVLKLVERLKQLALVKNRGE